MSATTRRSPHRRRGGGCDGPSLYYGSRSSNRRRRREAIPNYQWSWPVGTIIHKEFDDQRWYRGEVTDQRYVKQFYKHSMNYLSLPVYHITYEDDDEEDLEHDEMLALVSPENQRRYEQQQLRDEYEHQQRRIQDGSLALIKDDIQVERDEVMEVLMDRHYYRLPVDAVKKIFNSTFYILKKYHHHSSYTFHDIDIPAAPPDNDDRYTFFQHLDDVMNVFEQFMLRFDEKNLQEQKLAIKIMKYILKRIITEYSNYHREQQNVNFLHFVQDVDEDNMEW